MMPANCSGHQRIWVHQKAIDSALPKKKKTKPMVKRKKSIGRSVGSIDFDEEDLKSEWEWKEAHLLGQDEKEIVVRILPSTDEDDGPKYESDPGGNPEANAVTLTLPSSAMAGTTTTSSSDSFGAGSRHAHVQQPQVLLANAYPTDSETGVAVCPNDLIGLTHLHEPSVVECLKQRFFCNTIYTRTGPIMIALNPFRSLSHLYSTKVMELYWDRAEQQGGGGKDDEHHSSSSNDEKSDEELPPHIFEIADGAYRQMLRALDAQIRVANPVGCEQSILVSGESGAGKTVTTKYVMKYLATLSERLALLRGSGSKPKRKVIKVRRSAAGTNPSSRFSVTSKKVVAQPLWSMTSGAKNNSPISPGIGLKKTPVSPGIGLIKKKKMIAPPLSPGGFLKQAVGASSPGGNMKALPTCSPLSGSGSCSSPASSVSSASLNIKAPPLSPGAVGAVRTKSGELDDIQNISGSSDHGIEAQVLQCNPILESFGNARTVRNDNSSRFGKFIEIQFTRLGKLIGAQIETYLLEKVRLVQQNAGERNYHIFYELLLGESDDEELGLYHLLDHWKEKRTIYGPRDFKITSSGTYDRRDKVSDADTYQGLRRAMDTMNFNFDQQRSILGVVAAVLHGSNITFDEVDEAAHLNKKDGGGDGCFPEVDAFCQLMGLSLDNLECALCTARVVINKNLFERRLTAANAEKGLEALLKASYGALFDYLVKRINDSIAYNHRVGRATAEDDDVMRPVATISVLDIFGFESFTTNTFEQLCINFCNETLQLQFNSFVLENEQAEYEREGINWSFIEFPGNQDVIELIEKRGYGILSILDDHCRTPHPKDKAYALDVYKLCERHPRFSASQKQTYSLQFTVLHYAGPVEYTMEGMTEKNGDELPKEATDLLKGSTLSFVKELAKIIEKSHDLPVASESNSDKSRGHSRSSSQGSEPCGQRATVSEQFRRQLKNLRAKIDKTSPHYIRCLKPNARLQPGIFDTSSIAEQLKCGGILEAVRVSRSGFAQHYPHANFIARYGALAGIREKAEGTPEETRADCEKLIRLLSREVLLSSVKSSIENLIQLGKTKVFLSKSAFETLERSHGKRQELAATKLNSIFRGFLARIAYPSLLEAYKFDLAENERQIILEREARERRQALENERRIRKGLDLVDDDAEDTDPSADFAYGKLRAFAQEVESRKNTTVIPEPSTSKTHQLKWVRLANGQYVKQSLPVCGGSEQKECEGPSDGETESSNSPP